MLLALSPLIIAALIALVLIVLNVSTFRMNKKRRSEGKPPLTEEPKIVNVIDWTRR